MNTTTAYTTIATTAARAAYRKTIADKLFWMIQCGLHDATPAEKISLHSLAAEAKGTLDGITTTAKACGLGINTMEIFTTSSVIEMVKAANRQLGFGEGEDIHCQIEYINGNRKRIRRTYNWAEVYSYLHVEDDVMPAAETKIAELVELFLD